MNYPSANQPFAIKAINRIGRGLQAIGLSMPALNTDTIMAQAQQNTGLQDYGETSFIDALNILIDSLNNEAQLSQIGRIGARASILDELEKRLRLVDYRKKRPQVAEQKIAGPLFIAGLPRTGTTILYELLAQDNTHRSPATWEVSDPFPPAQEHSYYNDARIATVERKLAKTDMLAPEFKAIHAVGASLPQECVAMLASSFNSDQWGIQFYCPTYRRWALQQNMADDYQWHYRFLQHLQVDFAKPRWLLKTPMHIAYLDTLIAQYPDATIVQTHRDPIDVMGSVSSLACTLHSVFSDDIDPVTVAAEEVRHFSAVIARGMQQRDAIADADRRFCDVQFNDLISRPLSVIETIYQHFDVELTNETRNRMQRYLDHRPRDKHGTHSYTLEEFGLDKARDGQYFQDYRQRYCQTN